MAEGPISREVEQSIGLPPGFAESLERSIAAAELAVAQRSTEGVQSELPDLPEYRDVVRMKIRLELETARALEVAARTGTALTELASELRREEARARG